MQLFIIQRDAFFDISASNAIAIINNDKHKTLIEREEDKKFLQHLRNNKFVSFGKRDKEFDNCQAKRQKREEGNNNSQDHPLETEVTFLNSLSYRFCKHQVYEN